MFLGLLACTLESDLTKTQDDPVVFDSGDSASPDTSDTTTPVVPEECNGLDDDADGQVDEGYPDDNANGRADCLDEECAPLNIGPAEVVTIREECMGTTSGGTTEEVEDPWDVVQQWAFTAPSTDTSATSSWAQAVIGNLDDDNGDGQIDEDDSPEVVAVLWGSRAHIVAIDGATGDEKWVYSDGNTRAIAAIADVTGDGNPDVISNNASGQTIVLDGDGNLQWTATDLATTMGYYMVSTADLDQDGQPEVISDNIVLDGADGDLLWEMRTFGGSCPYLMAAVGDFDAADDDQEVTYCGVMYDSDGDELWDSGMRGSYGMWPVVLQADSDDEAEIGFAGEYWSLWEADGTNIYTVDYPSTQKHPGPPCAGDFDGDGVAEVGFPSYQDFVMYELDGTILWSAAMDDTSGLAGCSGYDVNGDGPLEVLFADQSSFKIMDGATGTVLYQDNSHTSGTIFEYPTVADIDHDDHAEIVNTNNRGGGAAVVAYEHGGDGWPAAGTTWAVHDFAITNIEPDGTVPQDPEPSWTKYNVYRSRVAADDPSTPDLVARLTDACVVDCAYGPVQIAVQVGNQGGADVSAGTLLAIYAIDDVGPRFVQTYTLPEIAAGTWLDGVQIDLAPADAGNRGFRIVVDDDGTGVGDEFECDETNNEDEWRDGFCF